jgi:hypothetical protein
LALKASGKDGNLPETPKVIPAMRIKLTSRNRLTLPKSVSAAFEGVAYFDVTAENGRIVLTPARHNRADAVRAKLEDLNLTEVDVIAAVAWARQA